MRKSSLLIVVRILLQLFPSEADFTKQLRETKRSHSRMEGRALRALDSVNGQVARLAPQARCLCYLAARQFRYFQFRTFPSASHAIAVCKRLDRVSSRFAPLSQSRYSFLLV